MAIAALFSLSLIISGCSNLEKQRMKAARDLGATKARVTLPAYPTECTRSVPHATLTKGGLVIVILKRERFQLDLANRKATSCAGFYEDLRKRLH